MSIGFPYDYDGSVTSLDSDGLEKKLLKVKSLHRRVRRFFRKRKFSKFHEKILEFQKYSLICFVGNSSDSLNGDESLVQLFLFCVGQAWGFFIKLINLIIKYSKKKVLLLIKCLGNHPWTIAMLAFMSIGLLITNRIVSKFGKKLRLYHYLVLFILFLIAVTLIANAIEKQYFKILAESIMSMLSMIWGSSDSYGDSYGDSYDSKLPIEKESKPSKDLGFKGFVVYSLLTVLTTRYLIRRAKRKLVGEGPFSDIIIALIDHMPYLSDFSNSQNESLSPESFTPAF